MEVKVETIKPDFCSQSVYKRRRISIEGSGTSISSKIWHEVGDVLPTLRNSDYYTIPCLSELANREIQSPGYCSRVPNFVIGRVGIGCIKFVEETDVRCLDLNSIVKFSRCEVVVYEDDSCKPIVGQGLNKPAEVTLLLHLERIHRLTNDCVQHVLHKLKCKTESQGAEFLSFDVVSGEWKFLVQHFSRFGLDSEDEEDALMEDEPDEAEVSPELVNEDVLDMDDEPSSLNGVLLSHSLPAHLGLDPTRMKIMKSLFPLDEDEAEVVKGSVSPIDTPSAPELSKSVVSYSSRKIPKKDTPIRKTPLALTEYKGGSFRHDLSGGILMSLQNRGLNLKVTKSEGFKLELQDTTLVSAKHSHNVVDAALFMGRSFRVGWGPNCVLVHSGKPACSFETKIILSSIVNLEKVAVDKATRNEGNEVTEELLDFCFISPLKLHKELSFQSKKLELETFHMPLKKITCDRFILSDICRRYINIIEGQLEVPTVSSSSRVPLIHQVLVWELIKVLFSLRKGSGQMKLVGDEEDMISDELETPDVDEDALPLLRRAEFSYWLQESVYHRVQADVGLLDDLNYLEHIFLLLTGRQLDNAVELAAFRGDVRLSCILSQAGGSTSNRADVAHQLDLWRKNGLDFKFIEDDRLRLLQLLAGDIRGSLRGVEIDWKRFLGMLMWYKLPPESSLPDVFITYQKLLNEGKAPYPVPVYIDEVPREDSVSWNSNGHFDLAYYLMLLHAKQESDFGVLKTMFSASASTDDPLDYHMIWHQRAILEAIGTFSSNDFHILDMAFVSQLLCAGLCHWAIYVVLHIPHREDCPYLHITVIREILFQYCEVWSSQESQWEFIENLGIPSAWLHEALAVYSSYLGDHSKALQNFLACGSWQRAHSIFLTSVAHSLFLSGKHTEIWNLAISMEEHKSEIEDWDLGAGIYISYYSLTGPSGEDTNAMSELDTLESKNEDFSNFIDRTNRSLMIWGNKLPVEGRVVYSKMAEGVCNHFLSTSGRSSSYEFQLSCFDTIFRAPISEDHHSHHLKDAVSLFTSYLCDAPRD